MCSKPPVLYLSNGVHELGRLAISALHEVSRTYLTPIVSIGTYVLTGLLSLPKYQLLESKKYVLLIFVF